MATLFYGIENLYALAGAAKKSGRQVTEADLTHIRNGVILERQGRILWAGEKRKLTSAWQKKLLGGAKLKKINLKAKTVVPAFLECHTHLIFAGDRRNEFELRNQGVNYQQIAAQGGGILSTVKATRAAKDSELLRLAQNRVTEFLRQGVTTVEIKSGYGLSHDSELRLLKVLQKLAKAIQKKGPRIVATYLGLHAKSPEHPDLARYIDEAIEKTLPAIHRQKLAQRIDIFVEKGFFTLADAKRFMEKANLLGGFTITVHADQLTRTGAGAFFTRAGAVSCDHLVQVSDDDVKDLAAGEATCVLLPASDFYMKVPYPPARKLIDGGARVALSTDFNPGTSPTQDISFLGVLARLEMKMQFAEVLSALTVGAAHALNLNAELGSLEHLKCCDFIVSDEDLHQFFYQVGHHPVRSVYREGQLVKTKPIK